VAQEEPDLLADDDGAVDVDEQPMQPMRTDLINLFDRDELAKYLTDEELPAEEPRA